MPIMIDLYKFGWNENHVCLFHHIQPNSDVYSFVDIFASKVVFLVVFKKGIGPETCEKYEQGCITCRSIDSIAE